MKKTFFAILLAALLSCFLAFSVFAASGENVYDEADLLSRTEEARLAEKLAEIGKQLDAQIVVMTLPSTDGSIDSLVEEMYDSMDMGYGENRDGVLLLVCMDTREYRILSNGYASQAIGYYEIDVIGEAIVSYLSDGDYADAFDTFAEQCAYYLDGYRNGFPFQAGETLVIALIIGVVVGLIVAFALKAQLTSVRQQRQANAYVKSGSMQITTRSDLFLYRNVSRTRRQSSNSSGGGSSRKVGGGSF